MILKPTTNERTKPRMQNVICPDDNANALADNELCPLLSNGELISDLVAVQGAPQQHPPLIEWSMRLSMWMSTSMQRWRR